MKKLWIFYILGLSTITDKVYAVMPDNIVPAGVTGFGPNDAPIGSPGTDPFGIVILIFSNIAEFVISLIPFIAMLMVAIAGWQYVQGSLDSKSDGKNTLMYAVMGLVVALLAYVITSMIISVLLGLGA